MTQPGRRIASGVVLPALMLAAWVQPASAEPESERVCGLSGSCKVQASWTDRSERGSESIKTRSGKAKAKAVPRVQRPNAMSAVQEAAARAADAERRFKHAAARYEAAVVQQRICLETNVPITRVGNSSAFCPAPVRPNAGLDTVVATLTPQRGRPVKNGPPRVTITPREVAYLAVARLQLPRVVPGIGPSPKLNEWDMAVVGYPLWLWADGPTRVGPVSQAVANLRVSLDARITKMVFRMGDGATVRCRGTGTKWSWRVGPAKKSPGCGHTYTKPSLPKGDYTVTAITYWAVRWSINGSSGVITLPMSSSTQLPVGELQVLVTR
jgi:hypothetical protein